MAENQSAEDKKSNASYLKSRMRKCHDCQALTWDYRCSKCRKKHLLKHGILSSVSDAED